MIHGFKEHYLKEAASEQVVITFGRFNPPTSGHEKLLDAVKKTSKGSTYRIYASQSQDAKKNPLDQTTKAKYMKMMFPKHKGNIVISSSKTALEIASELHDKGYTNLVMVVGSDRVKDFQSLLDRYNGDENKAHGFYDFDKIKVVSAGERDPDAEGVSGMSASKMREAALCWVNSMGETRVRMRMKVSTSAEGVRAAGAADSFAAGNFAVLAITL